VSDYISFSAARKAETAAYDKRHYGVSTWHLRPTVIVLHFTGSSTVAAARNTFASNSVNHGELPGTCAHFIIGQDGTVHAIVPTDVVCRHAIGLDDVAIGIEMAQSTIHNSGHLSDEQILNRPAQIGAALALVRTLQRQYSISSSNVIGHAMANQAPQFRDLEHWKNSHMDWQAQDVATFRSRLAKLA
jgi:N-acetyl-anhydromuramyl-L-alanine amidase AmpD